MISVELGAASPPLNIAVYNAESMPVELHQLHAFERPVAFTK